MRTLRRSDGFGGNHGGCTRGGQKGQRLGNCGLYSQLFLGLGIYFCIASIVGLVLSIVGMVQSKKCTLNGFAIAGLVLGIISLIIWGLVWLIVGAAIIGKGGTPA